MFFWCCYFGFVAVQNKHNSIYYLSWFRNSNMYGRTFVIAQKTEHILSHRTILKINKKKATKKKSKEHWDDLKRIKRYGMFILLKIFSMSLLSVKRTKNWIKRIFYQWIYFHIHRLNCKHSLIISHWFYLLLWVFCRKFSVFCSVDTICIRREHAGQTFKKHIDPNSIREKWNSQFANTILFTHAHTQNFLL